MGACPPASHENRVSSPAAGRPGDVGSAWYRESGISWTRELQAPRTVAASTPSRVSIPKLLWAPGEGGAAMDVILERCAGLDVHQATVAVTVRTPGPAGQRTERCQTFGSTTPD